MPAIASDQVPVGMPHRARLESHQGPDAPSPLRPAAGLRDALATGYSPGTFQADLLAGVVVGIVALPLSMALAIASGVPPQYGLYTAIVAGAVAPLLGGTRLQVTGPTAAFVVLLAPVAARFGLAGLLMATLLAGLIQVGFAIMRFGRLIEYMPHPVTTGFTSGIAVVIAVLQLPDLLGLTLPGHPEGTIAKLRALGPLLGDIRLPEVAVALLTLAILVLWPRLSRRVPSPLVALSVAALAAWLAARALPGWDVVTLGDRFTFDLGGGRIGHGVPGTPPMFGWPWAAGAGAAFSLEAVRALVPSAFAIAILGSIESLLSAVVADGMAGTRHDPDAELFGQGIGNLVAPWFGGFAATGAIARTATNVRAGGRTPLAAVVHAGFILAAVLVIAPVLSLLPMAALAALLLMVAWNMSELRHVGHLLRVAPRSDALVLAVCFGLTILFDMVVAVTVGVLLASLLFMRRMAELTGVRLAGEGVATRHGPVPPGVLVYEVAGPLFFGAAQKAMRSLHETAGTARTVVLDLHAVPALDATGLVALESAVTRLLKDGSVVILAAVQPQPMSVLARTGLPEGEPRLVLAPDLDAALELAGRLGGQAPGAG